MKLRFKKIRDVKSPVRGTRLSSGIDFFIPNDFTYTTLTKGQSILIPSGLKVSFPPGYDLVFDNKGGVTVNKSLIVGAKVVDADFQGEVFINVINVGDKTVGLSPGEKITQGIIRKVELCDIEEVDELYYESDERGEGMLGSTNETN